MMLLMIVPGSIFSVPTSQRGQVGVIILLIMAAMLTIGLSLATRTTEEVFVSEQQSESTRVFNAAEAGVEEALSSDLTTAEGGTVETIEGVVVNYTITRVNQLETMLFEGVGVSLDVTGVTTGQELKIEWSEENDCTNQDPASLLVSVFYTIGANNAVRYYALGACNRSDGFTLASTVNSNGLRRRYDLPLQTNDYMVRVKPVYNDTQVRIAGDGFDLPVQYYAVRSTAESTTGDETRVVEVNRTLLAAPSIMDYALFSGNTIIK